MRVILAALCFVLLEIVIFAPSGQAQVLPNPASGWWGMAPAPALGPKPRLNCGWWLRKHFGGRHGPEFNLARSWLKLPRTQAAPGAVVVWARRGKAQGGSPGGHVAVIVAMRGDCRALVQDNRGSYERNICNALGIVRG